LLLGLKACAVRRSDSLTIFSEALNSLADLAGAVLVLVFVRWAHRASDDDHPFGHDRAEPIAGLLVALFTAVLGFEVVRSAAVGLVQGSEPTSVGWLPIVALAVALVVKAGLARYFQRLGRALHSPAFRASAVDCRNDAVVAAQAIVGLLLAQASLGIFDRLSALAVGLYILYAGYRIGVENVDYLMGKAPRGEMLDRIRRAAAGVPSVREVDDLRAHHVGALVHVEITIRVDPDLSMAESHNVAEAARESVEGVSGVARAFIHVEPLGAELQASP
jgi:cation diffusion facilitator family transporter